MLQIKDLVGGYGSVQILNGATLKVARGQIVALLGGNGTGKSTLLKATSGLIKPWSGSITFDGERIDLAVLTDGSEVQVGKFRLTFYASRLDLVHLASD